MFGSFLWVEVEPDSFILHLRVILTMQLLHSTAAHPTILKCPRQKVCGIRNRFFH